MNANRRLQERKQPERMVFCKLGGGESGSVLNLSEDGLCIGSLTPIEEKDVLQLCLSVDLNSAIEATGQLAWIDSAKRTVGLRFLELSAPAREQICVWLSETSSASSGRNGAATAKPVIWQEMSVPSMQLVPIERHRAQTRCRFLLGVLVGFVICAVVMIPIFRYAGGTKRGSPAQSSADHTRASVAQAVSPIRGGAPGPENFRIDGWESFARRDRALACGRISQAILKLARSTVVRRCGFARIQPVDCGGSDGSARTMAWSTLCFKGRLGPLRFGKTV